MVGTVPSSTSCVGRLVSTLIVWVSGRFRFFPLAVFGVGQTIVNMGLFMLPLNFMDGAYSPSGVQDV